MNGQTEIMVKKIKVQILNAFVKNKEGGNPAGVVLNADNLSEHDMQEIAKKVGLSETAFVSESNSADFKLDFFTPNRRIAHCGHATVATFSYLKQQGILTNENSSKETVDGRRDIKLIKDLAFMSQKAPSFLTVNDWEDKICSSLGITSKDLAPDAPLQVVNTGNSFLIIPISSPDTLNKLKPKLNEIEKISDHFDLIGFYPFANVTNSNDIDAITRMFGPRYDIPEEAGTGMAAGPLACYLYQTQNVRKNKYMFNQGISMSPPSPSEIIVELDIIDDTISSLMAGGKGMLKEELTIEIN